MTACLGVYSKVLFFERLEKGIITTFFHITPLDKIFSTTEPKVNIISVISYRIFFFHYILCRMFSKLENNIGKWLESVKKNQQPE